MDKKERVKKFDEKLVVGLATVGMLAIFFVALWSLFNITIFAPIVSIFTPFVSLLILKKGIDIYSPKDASHVILALGVLCVFSLFAISENNGKHEANMNKWIYGGSVEKVRHMVEGDGAETVDHYEDFYLYKSRENDRSPSRFIHYLLLIFSWGAPIAHWILFVSASKKYDPNRKK